MLALCWCKSSKASKARNPNKPGNPSPQAHSFRSKTFRKSRSCDQCKLPVQHQGSACRNCKYACHKDCEVKVNATCEPVPTSYGLKSPSLVKSPEKNRRSRSLERHPSFAMDITYVTERIIVIVFPKTEPDSTYKSNLKAVTRMLRTKHGTNYMVFNLSEKRYDLANLNPQVLEFGWPQQLAPPLERLCSICKSIDSWVNTDPQNIAVLHSKGDKGRAGIVVAAYMHYSNICASADQALDRFAMKQFYDSKLSSHMQPSQKRYVHYFAGLLSGAIRMNNNPIYLHHIIIYGVPNFDSRGGCRPFVKIYQGMQHIYSSGVYTAMEKSQRIMINIDPGLQIRGDVLIKCYHKSHRPLGRFPIFRIQFHTCTIDSDQLTFEKSDLDDAVEDSRFSENGKVQFKFSYSPENFRGNGCINDVRTPVESANDPLVKWDSYENFDSIPEDSPNELDFLDADLNHEGPLDGSLYATVTKKKYTDISIQPHLNHDGFGDVDGPHSIDSGISSSSGARNMEIDSHNPSEQSVTRNNPHSFNLKEEQTELDELVHGMLKEIQSIPDAPTYSSLRPFAASLSPRSSDPKSVSSIKSTTIQTVEHTTRRNPNTPTSIISVNGNKQVVGTGTGLYSKPRSPNSLTLLDDLSEEESIPYHARKNCSPFSYSVETHSPNLERRRLLSDGHQPLGTSIKPSYYSDTLRNPGDNPQSWLQRQQEKLKARREGRVWDDRQQKEQQLMAELRWAQNKKPNGGESTDDVSLGIDFSSSSRETSPSKNLSYTLPLHVNTYNGYASSPPTGSLKPPIHRNTSAPSSPLLPHRSSSKEITRIRYPQFQTQNKAITRQKSDTSFDRERPFVTAKKAHQLAKEQIANNSTSPQHVIASSTVYSNVYPMHYSRTQSSPPENSDEVDLGLLAFSSRPGNKSSSTGSPALDDGSTKLNKLEQSLQALSGSPSSPKSPQDHISPFTFSQSTPKMGITTDAPSWSPSVVSTSPPASPSRMDRPETPAFPVPPGTPYQNQETSGSALPPKSPVMARKDRSPSPATMQGLRQELPNAARAHSSNGQSSPTVYYGQSRPSSMVSLSEPSEVIHHHPMFVKDTSKFWYKPDISREDAISLLKDKSPGTFVVRDSNSFPGAYGLALKVATPPPNIQNKSGDISSELVRHFLIEPTSKGVRLKGCANEPVFGSLSALVYQHSITPLALPCKLLLPEYDPGADATDDQTSDNVALLAQGAACSVLYLDSVDTESLTGPQAVRKALAETLAKKPLPTATPVHFKVSNQGITLTDNTRKLFFRRHYPVKTISHCGLDQEDRRWTQMNEGIPISTSRCFGFIARKPASQTDNQCHLFAELEPEQPASAIVNFVTKVMMAGTQQSKSNMV